jgi:SAM-dependent MidA family methyltransferase
MKDLLEIVNFERKKVIEEYYNKSREQLLDKIRLNPTAVDFIIEIDYPSEEIAQIISQRFATEGILSTVQYGWFKSWYYPTPYYYLNCTVRCQDDLLLNILPLDKKFTYEYSTSEEEND